MRGNIRLYPRLAELGVPAHLAPAVRRAILQGTRSHETGSAGEVYRDEEGAVVARYRFHGGFRDVVVL